MRLLTEREVDIGGYINTSGWGGAGAVSPGNRRVTTRALSCILTALGEILSLAILVHVPKLTFGMTSECEACRAWSD